MKATRTCAKCGATLAEDAPAGHCPKCLLAVALNFAAGADEPTVHDPAGDSADSAHPARPPGGRIPHSAFPRVPHAAIQRFGDYELLGEIARGGMGVVYRAWQVSLNRPVALKMILAGQLASAAAMQRFQTEARAAANLDHPYIVPIYEIGEHDGQPYFAMKLIEGSNLAARISNLKSPISNDEAARLLASVARAVHHAHQHGVLHRDLKPSNILLDERGQPHLTDFGLAKLMEQDSSVTQSLAILGTPSYMAPEQAAGNAKQLSTAADVYSLGAILYELLAGQPPFVGETVAAVLQKVIEEEPVPPSAILARNSRRKEAHDSKSEIRNPKSEISQSLLTSAATKIDRDLETICLKCLEKEPARRYSSAAALADDLERWLRHEPIQARPSTTWEHARKWARRKPALAGAIGVAIFVFVLGLGGVLWQSVQRQRALTETRRTLYVAQINVAQAALQAGDISRALSLLEGQRPVAGQEDARGFEWHYLRGLCRGDDALTLPGHDAVVQTLAVSPDGTVLATGGEGPRVRLWDLRKRQEIPSKISGVVRIFGLAFSPDGQFLAAADRSNVTLWEITTQKVVTRSVTGGVIWRVIFSPDGQRLAAASRGSPAITSLLEVPTLRLMGRLANPGNDRPSLAYSADGRWLAMGQADGTVRLLDTTNYQERIVLRGHDQPVVDLGFSLDSRTLVTASEDGTARLWEVTTRREMGALVGHRRRVTSVAFSNDGQWLATGCIDGTIKLWDAKSRLELATLRGHEAWVNAVLFLPDGHTLASASDDNTTRLWELGRLLKTDGTIDPFGLARVALFGPDGSTLLTGHDDGAVNVHYLDSERTPEYLPGTGEPIGAIAVAADSKRLAAASGTHRVQVWQLNPAQLLVSSNLACEAQYRLAFANAGRSLTMLCGNYAYLPLTFDASVSGKFLSSLEFPKSEAPINPQILEAVAGVAVLSSDSPCLWLRSVGEAAVLGFAVSGHDLEIRSYPANRLIGRLEAPGGPAVGAISPDGRFAAVRCVGTNPVRVWDAHHQRQIISPLAVSPIVWNCRGFEFSRDSNLLAVGTDTGSVHLLKSPRFEPVGVLRGHSGWITSIAFSPDRRTMATAGNDGGQALEFGDVSRVDDDA